MELISDEIFGTYSEMKILVNTFLKKVKFWGTRKVEIVFFFFFFFLNQGYAIYIMYIEESFDTNFKY